MYFIVIYIAVSILFAAVTLGYMFLKNHERIGCGIFCILIAIAAIFLAVMFFVNHDMLWNIAQGTADAISIISVAVIAFILMLFLILF